MRDPSGLSPCLQSCDHRSGGEPASPAPHYMRSTQPRLLGLGAGPPSLCVHQKRRAPAGGGCVGIVGERGACACGDRCYNRRDLDAILQHMASDFMFDRSRSISLNRGVLTLDEFRRWMEEMWATFEVQRFEVDEFIEAGEASWCPSPCAREGARIESRPTPQSWPRSATAPSLGWRCTTSCGRPSKPPGCRSRRLAAITGPPGAVMPGSPTSTCPVFACRAT